STVCVPDAARLPVQPLLAVQPAALVLDQVMVAAAPADTVVGDTDRFTVDVAEAGGVVDIGG
ncbi:MAG TPA: hypothetical protein VHZ99_11575, partial [Steroidobacteraceae bacterium]|nr:hypothetical protein [Steroidobacteraceae bacterium]